MVSAAPARPPAAMLAITEDECFSMAVYKIEICATNKEDKAK
jgi:hypothetical protein